MFKQLYLSEILSELVSEHINTYIFSLTFHEYVQNKFLTCTREVADPILSQNNDLQYASASAKLLVWRVDSGECTVAISG